MSIYLLCFTIYPSEIIYWCRDNTKCDTDTYNGCTYLTFAATEDAILFRLRWGCYQSIDPHFRIVHIGDDDG